MQFFNVSGTRLACFTRLFKTNSGWPRGNPSPCFLGCKCFAQKFGAGLGTLISQHFCSRGEVPWANPHQWPAANNGPSVSTMDRAQTSQKCRNCTKTKIDLFCFLSKQDMMKLYVDAQRKRDQKSMIRVFPLGHAFRLPWGIFHTLQWQCTYQVSYTHVTTKLQPFAEMIYFALPSFGSKSHQPTMEPWNRRKFPH